MKKNILISVASGLLGMILALSAWHIYNDHKIFHALLNSIAQQQQKQVPDAK